MKRMIRTKNYVPVNISTYLDLLQIGHVQQLKGFVSNKIKFTRLCEMK